MHGQSEQNLIMQCKSGDPEAFSLLIKIYRRRLAGYIFRMCPDRTVAEDVMQDTLIKVWRGFGKYDERKKFASWLFSVAHNTAIDALRKADKRKIFQNKPEMDIPDDFSSPDKQLESSELGAAIDNAVGSLPEKQRQVFLLRQHSGLTFREIAEQLDLPLNTVLGQMHQAVLKLKKVLKIGLENE